MTKRQPEADRGSRVGCSLKIIRNTKVSTTQAVRHAARL